MRSFGSCAALIAAISLIFISCENQSADSAGKGRLRLKFDANPSDVSKVSEELPDTNDFLLTISKENGTVIFDGLYCDAADEFELPGGNYLVYVRSTDFTKPAFSEPQFGDEQCAVIPSGGDVSLRLDCRQLNAGVRLKVDPDFLSEYPNGVLFLKSNDGKLMYSYSEKRIAYFKPGSVSLVLSNGSSDETLMTRVLSPQEILTLKVSVLQSSASTSGVSISLDTSRVWSDETYILGSTDKGSSDTDAMTVNQAMASIGEEDVWVNGFIVGGDLTSTSASFSAPFKTTTNLILAPRKTVTSRDNCIAVQLPIGEVRDALNLVGNPSLLGSEVCLKGDIVESYFGLVGLKNVSDYILK